METYLTRLGVPSIAGRLLKVIETCVYPRRKKHGSTMVNHG